MVVRENELEVLISTWRDKLFSVQNTILELLEGLDRLETQKIIQTRSCSGSVRVKEEERSPMMDAESMGEEGWGRARDLVEVNIKEGHRTIDEQLPDHFLNNPSLTISSVQDSDAMEEENNAEESSQSTLNSTNTGQENNERMYQCDFCEYQTKVKFSLNRHLQLHEENPMQAEQQNQMQQNQINKVQMNLQNQLQKIKSCDHCDYTTKRADFLKKHIQKHHPQVNPPVQKTVQNAATDDRRMSSRHYGSSSNVQYTTSPTVQYTTSPAVQYATTPSIHYPNNTQQYTTSTTSSEQFTATPVAHYTTPSSAQYTTSSVQYTTRPNVEFDKYSCAHCRYITTRIGDLKKHMASEHPKETMSVQLKTTQPSKGYH